MCRAACDPDAYNPLRLRATIMESTDHGTPAAFANARCEQGALRTARCKAAVRASISFVANMDTKQGGRKGLGSALPLDPRLHVVLVIAHG